MIERCPRSPVASADHAAGGGAKSGKRRLAEWIAISKSSNSSTLSRRDKVGFYRRRRVGAATPDGPRRPSPSPERCPRRNRWPRRCGGDRGGTEPSRKPLKRLNRRKRTGPARQSGNAASRRFRRRAAGSIGRKRRPGRLRSQRRRRSLETPRPFCKETYLQISASEVSMRAIVGLSCLAFAAMAATPHPPPPQRRRFARPMNWSCFPVRRARIRPRSARPETFRRARAHPISLRKRDSVDMLIPTPTQNPPMSYVGNDDVFRRRRAWLRFSKGPFVYTIFSAIGKWGLGMPRGRFGVAIQKGGKEFANFPVAPAALKRKARWGLNSSRSSA